MVFVLKLLLYKRYLISQTIWLLHFYYYIILVNLRKGILYDARFEKLLNRMGHQPYHILFKPSECCYLGLVHFLCSCRLLSAESSGVVYLQSDKKDTKYLNH